MNGWPSFTVAELQASGVLRVEDGNHGEYRPRPHEFVDGGTAYIRAADISGDRVRFNDAAGINQAALGRIRKGVGQPGDLLFSHKGTVGKLARVPRDAPPFICSPQTTFWRVLDEKRMLREYLYAYMRSRAFIDQWWVRKGETDMADYVSLTAQRQLRITLPPVDVQARIAEPLSAMDDLIANNRQRIQLLNEMSRLVHKEWFVRLRYPGHENAVLVNSPLGPIPEGWKACDLFEIADVGFGFSFKAKHFGERGAFPVIRIRDIPNGVTKTFTNEQPPERYRVIDGDVLIGMDGEFHMRQWTDGLAWLNQRVVRLRPRGGIAARHLMLALDGPIRAWNAAITGTTVAHLGKRHLEQIRVAVPPPPLRAVAAECFNEIAQKEMLLAQASRRLTTIRDALLPKLVTGQIDVSDLDLDAVVDSLA